MKANTTAHEESILESLISGGWNFRSRDEALQLIKRVLILEPKDERHIAGRGESLDLVESELLSMDLRSFGGRTIPDVTMLKKSSYLCGPKVLQVVSVRDIYHSCIDASLSTSQYSRRLLRFVLTDGNGVMTAIEYGSIPTIKKEIVPGTKVRLENRIAIYNGILCLDAKTITLLGGMVQSLYEEWKMDQKYSGIARSTTKPSNHDEKAGPPPFEKLRVGRQSHKELQHCDSHSHSGLPDPVIKVSNIDVKQELPANSSSKTGNIEVASTSTKNKGTETITDIRPKEVVEVAPIQNQAASQKLLQKLSQENHQDRHYKGNRQRGKYREEIPVFTLDEWERRKTGSSKSTMRNESSYVNHDEELAWQLQRQLDLEDSHIHHEQQTEAEKIRMSMFSFERGEERNDESRGRRGRGRGGGRGRGRGGGRGRNSR